MKQIPLATKSLRHKDTQSKENQISFVNLSDFVTLWRNNFLLNCFLIHIVFGFTGLKRGCYVTYLTGLTC